MINPVSAGAIADGKWKSYPLFSSSGEEEQECPESWCKRATLTDSLFYLTTWLILRTIDLLKKAGQFDENALTIAVDKKKALADMGWIVVDPSPYTYE